MSSSALVKAVSTLCIVLQQTSGQGSRSFKLHAKVGDEEQGPAPVPDKVPPKWQVWRKAAGAQETGPQVSVHILDDCAGHIKSVALLGGLMPWQHLSNTYYR